MQRFAIFVLLALAVVAAGCARENSDTNKREAAAAEGAVVNRNSGDADYVRATDRLPAEPPPIPSYDPAPRRRTILAAGRYGWTMTIIYHDEMGIEHKAKVAPPPTRGIASDKIVDIQLVLDDGTEVPLERIKWMFVDAANDETSRKYRVGPRY